MDPLNLILLIIVVLIGLRLRSVLGTRNDDEAPGSRADAYRLNRDAFAHKGDAGNEKLEAPVDETSAQEAPTSEALTDEPVGDEAPDDSQQTAHQDGSQMGRGLAFLRDVEPQFDEAEFLDGAARAYEMILAAFADGDLSPIEGFLGADVTDGFATAIVERADNDQQLVTHVLRLDRPALEDASVSETTMQLDVRFRAEIISGTFPAGQEISDDDLPAPTTSIDVWRFEGQRGGSPNWTLIATQAG